MQAIGFIAAVLGKAGNSSDATYPELQVSQTYCMFPCNSALEPALGLPLMLMVLPTVCVLSCATPGAAAADV